MKKKFKLVGMIALITAIILSFAACGDAGGGGDGDGGASVSEAYSIAVEGGNIYVAGYYYDSGIGFKACYWKNDGLTIEKTDLPTAGAASSSAKSIVVEGGNIYVAGYYYNAGSGSKACYWKNDGLTTVMTDLH